MADAVLSRLADRLREDHSLLSDLVVEPKTEPEFGPIAAVGPRAAADPAGYSLIVEAVREGYLLHYGKPRVLSDLDDDLALLAGDYLYAIGIERLAAMGDSTSVEELSDLISLSAQCHAEGRSSLVDPLWSVVAKAVGYGPTQKYLAAKTAVKSGDSEARELLDRAERETSDSGGDGLDAASPQTRIDSRTVPDRTTHG